MLPEDMEHYSMTEISETIICNAGSPSHKLVVKKSLGKKDAYRTSKSMIGSM